MNGAGNGFKGPLEIAYRPPRTVFMVASLMHAGAVAGIVLAALPALVKWCAVPAVVAAWLAMWRNYRAQVTRVPAPRLRFAGNDAWSILEGPGERIALRFEPGAFVHPHLQVLRFRDAAGARRVFLLTVENADEEVLRRLRVRLRVKQDGDGYNR